MEENKKIEAIQMGALAGQALSEGCTGKVMGLTSKGMFLNTGERVLFITEAAYKSPFNIQVSSMANVEKTVSVGDTWHFTEHQIIFDQSMLRVDIQQSSIWQPANPPEINTELSERAARLGVILRRMHALDAEKGWLFLTDPGSWFGDGEKTTVFERTANFLDAVETSNLDAALESGKHILGRGGGLTPSFLLYFSRLGQQSVFLKDLGKSLTALAFERTTKISANRIEAACQSWSESLFLEVLDHLFCEEIPFTDEKIDYLVNFGHSSGVDTCVGFYSALCADLPIF